MKLIKRSLKTEPALALFASEHGLGFYHRLFKQAGQYLTTTGQIFGRNWIYDQEESIQNYYIKPMNTHRYAHDMMWQENEDDTRMGFFKRRRKIVRMDTKIFPTW